MPVGAHRLKQNRAGKLQGDLGERFASVLRRTDAGLSQGDLPVTNGGGEFDRLTRKRRLAIGRSQENDVVLRRGAVQPVDTQTDPTGSERLSEDAPARLGALEFKFAR